MKRTCPSFHFVYPEGGIPTVEALLRGRLSNCPQKHQDALHAIDHVEMQSRDASVDTYVGFTRPPDCSHTSSVLPPTSETSTFLAYTDT